MVCQTRGRFAVIYEYDKKLALSVAKHLPLKTEFNLLTLGSTRRRIYIRREGANGESKQNKKKKEEKPLGFSTLNKMKYEDAKRGHIAKQYILFFVCGEPRLNRLNSPHKGAVSALFALRLLAILLYSFVTEAPKSSKTAPL